MAADEEREPAPPGDPNEAGSSNAGDMVRKDGPAQQALALDADAALEHLRWLRPDGWVVTAIANGGQGIATKTFGPSTEQDLRAFLQQQNVDLQRNVYVHVNPTLRPMTKKAEATDIAALEFLHVDIDPNPGEDIGAERARIQRLLAECPGLPRPSRVVFSGGGYQALWRLDKPEPIGGEQTRADDAKLFNLRIEHLLGGDRCHNVDRVLRLPGTINWPNEKKRERGQVPELARVIETNDGAVYPLSKFEKAPLVGAPPGAAAPVAFDRSKVGAPVTLPENLHPAVQWLVVYGCEKDVLVRIRDAELLGDRPDHKIHEWIAKKDSRSEAQFFATCEMVRCGLTPEQVLTVLCDDQNGIARAIKKIGDGKPRPRWKQYAERQVQKALEAVRSDLQRKSDANIGAMLAPFEGKGGDGKDLPLELRFRMRLAQLGVRLEYDEFQHRTLIHGLPGFGPHLDDKALVRLRLLIDPNSKRPISKELLDDLCMNEAQYNRRHPVREFLDEVQPTWDGVARLDTWMIEYLGAPDTPYVRAVSRIFLVAAVRRVRQPGCKYDELVVMEGPQGNHKSSLLTRLAVREDWFTDDFPLNADGKRVIEMTEGKWIVECGELKGMRKNDVEALKAMLSRRRDRARLAYGRKTTEVPRQWVAAGTTNNRKYLRDQTGNRRFWPVPCGKFDLERFTPEIVRQLWAEAATEEAKGDPRAIRLAPELYDAAAEVQRERTADDPLLQVLVDALDGRQNVRIPTDDVWTVLGAADPSRRTQELNERVGEIMQRLGYVNVRRRLDGELRYHYVHGQGEHLLRARVDPRNNGFIGWQGENVPPKPF